jgi:hypothetical protein
VYMSTCGFGSNGTTSRRAVSYRRMLPVVMDVRRS